MSAQKVNLNVAVLHIQTINIFEVKKFDVYFVLRKNLSLNLIDGNCPLNSQSCFKGFKGICVD